MNGVFLPEGSGNLLFDGKMAEAKEKGLPIALTAEYGSWDEVISDIEWLDKL